MYSALTSKWSSLYTTIYWNTVKQTIKQKREKLAKNVQYLRACVRLLPCYSFTAIMIILRASYTYVVYRILYLPCICYDPIEKPGMKYVLYEYCTWYVHCTGTIVVVLLRGYCYRNN